MRISTLATHLFVLAFLSLPVRADLQNELDAMFGSMTNATGPTAHLGQRRGVLSGGSIVSRNDISSINLVNLQLPSFSAGCGGIDLFAGSFSFINLDQFIQLLRNVASNAAGYAFEVALGAMCKDCLQTIETLQKKVQSLNSMFSNSCELAQGIVNDSLDAMGRSDLKKTSASLVNKGFGDVFESFTSVTGQDPRANLANTDPVTSEEIRDGNIVWRSLVHNGAAGWYTAGDNQLMEAAMSLAGTVVITYTPDTSGEMAPDYRVIPPILTLKDLLEGGANVDVWTCTDGFGETQCLTVSKATIQITGLANKVRDMLIGGNGNVGIINRFSQNLGNLTTAEESFVELAPGGGIGAQIRNLARFDPGIARSFVNSNYKAIALYMAYEMGVDLINAAQAAVAAGDYAFGERAAKLLEDSRGKLNAQYESLVEQYGSPVELVRQYLAYAQASPVRQYNVTGRGINSND